MSFWSRVLGRKAPDYDLNGNRFYNEYIVERSNDAWSKPVKIASALRAGVKIAEDVGRVDMRVVRISETDDGPSRKLVTNDVSAVLTRRPNGWQTPMEFVESVMMKALFEGVGRAFILRDGMGKAKELLPLLDGQVTASRTVDGAVLYSGHVNGFGYVENASRDDFIEVGNPFWTDIQRLDPCAELKEIFGLARRFQDRQSDDANIRSLRGFITFAEAVGDETASAVAEALKLHLPGVPILDSGADFKALQASATEMQLLESRRHMIEEVARAFGIHPLMLGHDAAGQSLTRVADVADYHLNVTIAPWLKRWKQAIEYSLLKPTESVEFDTDSLFRMSPLTRAEYLSRALGAGGNKPWLTEDEAREEDGRNPKGEAFWRPSQGVTDEA